MSAPHPQHVRQLVDEAQLALQAGQYELALEHAQQALRADPSHTEARLVEARCQLHCHRPIDALQSLDSQQWQDTAMNETPDTALLRARAMLQAGRSEEAVLLLSTFCEVCPGDARLHRTLATACLQRNEKQAAAYHLREVLSLSPADQVARRTLARVVGEKDPEAAARVLVGGPRNGDHWMLHHLAAQYFRRAGRLAESQQIYRVLIEQSPHDALLWREAGELADDMGVDHLAVRNLERSLAIEPDDNTWRSLAIVHMHAGRFEQAGACWRRCTRGRALRDEGWLGLLACAVAAGRQTLARRVRERIDRLGIDRKLKRQTFANIWSHVTSGLVAVDVRTSPRDGSARRTVLERLMQQARQTLVGHARRYPKRADTHYHIAQLCRASGEKDAATIAANQALTINPRYESARQLAEELAAE